VILWLALPVQQLTKRTAARVIVRQHPLLAGRPSQAVGARAGVDVAGDLKVFKSMTVIPFAPSIPMISRPDINLTAKGLVGWNVN